MFQHDGRRRGAATRGSEQFFGEREFLASYFTAEEMEYLKLRRYW